MKILTLEEHRSRMENLRRADADIRSCTRELRIKNYLPGQVIYFLGDYPAKFSIAPTEYDYELLESYAKHGVDMIQVHEEWNDSIERYGATKYTSHDHEGMLKFVELCHRFGIKVIAYCSSSYIDMRNKDFTPAFLRDPNDKPVFMQKHMCYGEGSASSAEWRNFIIPKTFEVMDTYGFDGIYNDWGVNWNRATYQKIPPERRNYEKEHLKRYDPEAEDMIHMIYDGVHERGGIYKLHIRKNLDAPVRGKYYDYLWIGECKENMEYGAGKMYEPFVVPCPDKPKLINEGAQLFDMDEYFASVIPFVQFPLLTHGRPVMGRGIDVPGVEQFGKDLKGGLYQHVQRIRDYAEAHPNGPYSYSTWSQVPDDVEDYPRWCRYLALYKPMVEDETVVHMELRDSAAILSEIPQNVFITLFTNQNDYLVVSNMNETPYTVELRDEWINRETNVKGSLFAVPPKRIVFLKRL